MKRLLKLTFVALMPITLLGQNFQEKFQECLKSNDTTCQLSILQQWEKESPDNPEIFTSYFNYHFMKARKEVMALSTECPKGDALEVRDSSENIAAYLGSNIYYDLSEVKKGIDKINIGIQKYPNRLDMRFGKIYVLGQLKNWDKFTDEIILAVNFSAENNNKWTWTNDKKQEDGIDFFLASIQDYQVQLYNLGNDSSLLNMRKIANPVLTHYPEHIKSLSNLSISYLLLDEVDKGLEPLLKAEKIAPKDENRII